jgi:DNA-binding MarR family transcriptional regulator
MAEPTVLSDDGKLRVRLWRTLLKVSRRTENDLRDVMRVHHRTTLPRHEVAEALLDRQNEPTTMTDLGRNLLVSGGNVTAVVSRLVADGIVQRTRSGEDGRTFYVTLTEKGRDVAARQRAGHEARINQLFSGLENPETVFVESVLRSCVDKFPAK